MATTTVVTKENLYELTKLLIEQGTGHKVLDDTRIQNPFGEIVQIKGIGDTNYTILVRKERAVIPTNNYVYLAPFKDNSARDKAREWFFNMMKAKPGALLWKIMTCIFKKATEGNATEPNTVTVVSKITPLLTEAIKKELAKLDLKGYEIGAIDYNNSTKTAYFTSPLLADEECSKKHGAHDTFKSEMHDNYPDVSWKTWVVVKKTLLAILETDDISEWAENATVQHCQMASAILNLSWKMMSQMSGLHKELLNDDLQTVREGELLQDMESYANIERYLSVTPLAPSCCKEDTTAPNPADSYVIPGSNRPVAPPPPTAMVPVAPSVAPGVVPVVAGPSPADFRPAGSLSTPAMSAQQLTTRMAAFNPQGAIPMAPVAPMAPVYGQPAIPVAPPIGGYY